MRWFKHLANARQNPKLKAARKDLGEAAYGRFFKLVELVAERGGKADDFQPVIDLSQLQTNLTWLAEELGIPVQETRKTIKLFVRLRLIDPESWSANCISIPQMTEYLDEWTGRRHRINSRATPEDLRTDSDQRERERQDEEENHSRK